MKSIIIDLENDIIDMKNEIININKILEKKLVIIESIYHLDPDDLLNGGLNGDAFG